MFAYCLATLMPLNSPPVVLPAIASGVGILWLAIHYHQRLLVGCYRLAERRERKGVK